MSVRRTTSFLAAKTVTFTAALAVKVLAMKALTVKVLAVTVLVAMVAVGMMFAGCSRNKGRTVSVIGSTSVQPFAEMLADEFNSKHSDMYVEVQGGGSTAGIQAVESGYANIGMCSRMLKSDEHYTPITIALDGVAVVVHPSNPVDTLTLEQIRGMFSGKITNWKEVGGKDVPITLITREEGSGTREAFTQLVMDKDTADKVKKIKSRYKDPATMPAEDKTAIEELERNKPRITMYTITEPSNGSVKALVMGDAAGIGYMSLGQVKGEVKALKIRGVGGDVVDPTAEAVLSGKYPLVRPFLFVIKGTVGAESQKFIDYVLSDEAQRILENKGLIRAPKKGQK